MGAAATVPAEPQPRALTAEEGEALLDHRARALLGMSADEFRARWHAGELDRDDDDVIAVWMLLPFGR